MTDDQTAAEGEYLGLDLGAEEAREDGTTQPLIELGCDAAAQ
jgi:hypothetical protein